MGSGVIFDPREMKHIIIFQILYERSVSIDKKIMTRYIPLRLKLTPVPVSKVSGYFHPLNDIYMYNNKNKIPLHLKDLRVDHLFL